MQLKSVIICSVFLIGVATFIQLDVFREARTSLTSIRIAREALDAVYNICSYNTLKGLLSYLHLCESASKNAKSTPIVRYGSDRIFTKEELSYYTGQEGSPGLYIAILGQIYDVSKGEKHYAPGCAYHFFTGVDGTKAFVTGEFTEKGLTDDVTGLLPEQMLELENWIDFYHKTYDYKGKVTGHFYDERGQPTIALLSVNDMIEEGHLKKKKDDEFRQWFPPCNSAHTSEGGWVSCSDRSGGVKRDWVGVPRKYHIPGKDVPRCVCVRTEGPPYNDPTSNMNRGDLDNPHLEEYKGCDTTADVCELL